MANKVYNVNGGLHSAAALGALEDSMYGSSVASTSDFVASAGTGMNVSLSAGNGLISTGTGYAHRIGSDAANTIAIDAASSSDRIDSIVAYIDNGVTPSTSVTDNTNGILKFTAVTGTPAATPVAPNATTIQSAIGAGNPYMVLWDVTIPANATALNTATYTDRRVIAAPASAITALQNEISTFKSSLIIDDFDSTDSIGTITNITIDSKSITLAQSADGSTFKFYGSIFLGNSTGSTRYVTPVAVPGLSGVYGRATGLFLNSAPSEAYQIMPAGLRTNNDNSKVIQSYTQTIAVGTDGQIYIWVTQNSTGISMGANTAARFFWYPCVYFNTNFGDDSGGGN